MSIYFFAEACETTGDLSDEPRSPLIEQDTATEAGSVTWRCLNTATVSYATEADSAFM